MPHVDTWHHVEIMFYDSPLLNSPPPEDGK